jgi:hypothetical protein
MEVSGQPHASAAVTPHAHMQRAPTTKWVGDWRGARARLDILEKR